MPTTTFKYQKYLDNYKNCPPKSYAEREMTAYRWVFETCGEESFVPVKIINPDRSLGSNDFNCKGYGLSLFKELDGALQKYNELVQKKSGLKNTLGTHIAEINLEKTDGVASSPEKENFLHFTFHEYKDLKLSKKVVNIAILL